jgi:IclR family pca regulon transcriptional regulator
VLDGDLVVTVEVGNAVNGHYVLQPHELGRRIPATATSVGRMLLAFQDGATAGGSGSSSIDDHNLHAAEQIRRQGFAMSSGLLEAGVRTIAVPVYDSAGGVVAGLAILADADRTSAEELAGDHLVELRAAADRLAELAGV